MYQAELLFSDNSDHAKYILANICRSFCFVCLFLRGGVLILFVFSKPKNDRYFFVVKQYSPPPTNIHFSMFR